MATQQHRFTLTLLLIFVLCVNLFNVSSVYADGETPTEPPVATQVETETAATEVATEIPTEPPVEETPVPSEATPLPEETTATPVPSETTPLPEELTPTPVAELLTQVPESTEVIVLDENGETLPLASEEASEIVEVVDPMWCPVDLDARQILHRSSLSSTTWRQSVVTTPRTGSFTLLQTLVPATFS
jgi:hypothetical protein